jgi:hypothetical protein
MNYVCHRIRNNPKFFRAQWMLVFFCLFAPRNFLVSENILGRSLLNL